MTSKFLPQSKIINRIIAVIAVPLSIFLVCSLFFGFSGAILLLVLLLPITLPILVVYFFGGFLYIVLYMKKASDSDKGENKSGLHRKENLSDFL